MDVMKSLIALSVSTALMGGYADLAVAKKTDEEDSVYRWGRWAVLVPEAGNEDVGGFALPQAVNEIGRCGSGSNCPQPQALVVPPPNNGGGGGEEPPPPPEVGEAVGFARIDYRVSGSPESFDRYVGTISAEPGSTADNLGFVITGPSAPDGETVTLTSGLLPVDMTTEGFRSTERGNPSSISGQFTYGEDGEIAIVEGPWRQIGGDGVYAHSGEYVGGITATDAQLTALMNQLGGTLGSDVIAFYSGPTATGGSVYLDMNLTQATWNGSVDGTVLDFNASGTIDQARFTADQIDSYVSDDISGEMQGALVNAGNNAIGSFAVEADLGEGGVLREADVFNASLGEAPRAE